MGEIRNVRLSKLPTSRSLKGAIGVFGHIVDLVRCFDVGIIFGRIGNSESSQKTPPKSGPSEIIVKTTLFKLDFESFFDISGTFGKSLFVNLWNIVLGLG